MAQSTAVKRKERRRAWIEKNPLRVWRKGQGLAMMDVAASLNIAFSSVQQHEQGGYFPEHTIEKYAKVMRVPVDQLSTEWNDWLAQAPTIR
jgi:DNA-binding XRE family transcriptional regulator